MAKINDFLLKTEFLDKNKIIAQKSIEEDSFLFENSDEYYVFWTKKLNSQEVLNYPKENFELTYNFLQENQKSLKSLSPLQSM